MTAVIIFDNWTSVWHALVKAALAYSTIVLVLRISGKRTLSKLNAFDLVVTVALGSVLATMALASDVALTEGAVVIGVLALAQFVVTAASVRWSPFRQAVRAAPVCVLHHGELLHETMVSARLTESEVAQAVRSSGAGNYESIAAVVLETDGSLSVIAADQYGQATAMTGVDMPPPIGHRPGQSGSV